jgi:hypothetical protein
MKTKKIELDVDIIGGQRTLTVAEEKVLSDFFRKRKLTSNKSINFKRSKSVKRQRISV